MFPTALATELRTTIPLGRILRLAALTLLVLATASAAFAQRPGGGRGRGLDPDQRLERLTQRLDLSEAQQEKIKPLMEEETDEIRKILESAGVDPEARAKGARPGAGLSEEQRSELRSQVEAVHQQTATAIEAELDEEQVTQYRELREKAREKRRGRQSGGRGGRAGSSQP